jgi:hypothetical protein
MYCAQYARGHIIALVSENRERFCEETPHGEQADEDGGDSAAGDGRRRDGCDGSRFDAAVPLIRVRVAERRLTVDGWTR